MKSFNELQIQEQLKYYEEAERLIASSMVMEENIEILARKIYESRMRNFSHNDDGKI